MPYFRLSAMYFFYFGIFGVLAPYLGRYLKAYSYDFSQIGSLMAVITGVNIIAPFAIARLSDKSGKRLLLAKIATVLMIVAVLALNPSLGFAYTFVILGLFGAAMSMVMPQLEAVTVSFLKDQQSKYSRIRLWGGIGFIVAVAGTSRLLDAFDVQWFRWALLILCVGLLLSLFLVQEQPFANAKKQSEAKESSGLEKLAIPSVLVMFIVMSLNQVGLAPYNTFIDLYLQHFGYPASSTGNIIAAAVVVEVLVMAMMPLILNRLGYFPVLIGSFALTFVRWLIMIYFVESLAMVLVAQALHAVNYGTVHAVAIMLIFHMFSKEQQGMGQSLYVSFGMGLGLVSGNLVSGWLWQFGPEKLFMFSAVIALFSLVLSLWKLSPKSTGCH